MPFSCYEYIPPVLKKLYEIEPELTTVLDVGIGYGQWGALTRFHTDLYRQRIEQKDWKLKIRGIEGFLKYRNPFWDHYNSVEIGEACALLKKDTQYYDLGFIVEVLEHLEKPQALGALDWMVAHCKHLFFSYSNLEQGAWGGNDYEIHRSKWTKNEILSRHSNAGVLFDSPMNVLWYLRGNGSASVEALPEF